MLAFAFGPFQLDTTAYRLTRDGVVVDASPRQLDLLAYFASRPAQLVTWSRATSSSRPSGPTSRSQTTLSPNWSQSFDARWAIRRYPLGMYRRLRDEGIASSHRLFGTRLGTRALRRARLPPSGVTKPLTSTHCARPVKDGSSSKHSTPPRSRRRSRALTMRSRSTQPSLPPTSGERTPDSGNTNRRSMATDRTQHCSRPASMTRDTGSCSHPTTRKPTRRWRTC